MRRGGSERPEGMASRNIKDAKRIIASWRKTNMERRIFILRAS